MKRKINNHFQNKNLSRVVFLLFTFFILWSGSISTAEAGVAGCVAGVAAAPVTAGLSLAACGLPGPGEIVGNLVVDGFKWLLYGLLLILVQFTQVGASVFAWATRPEYISGPTGLLNLDSVYELWKFVRDFFNLFFIFLLLFSAFATVFQIESFSLKKNFGKIIFAAIAINFSFPLTRIIIDLGNVPMYFFASGIVSPDGGNSLLSIPSALWSSTNMGDILAKPNPNENATIVNLLTAIIFTFIFMITLVTLAFLFVLRLLKLVIWLILSPAGLAATIVPGLKKYGDKWWDQLIQTVFFGPAAMFMIVLALRFSAEIQGSGFAQGLSGTAPATSGASQSSIISQGVFFIPIIMMWMAMAVAKSSGIQGAKFVTDRADKALAWGKKQALFKKGSITGWAASPVTTRGRGAYKGLKTGAYEGRLFGKNYGDTKLGKLITPKKYKERGEDVEAAYQGFMNKGSKGVMQEQRKAQDRRISAKKKEFQDDLLSRNDLEAKLLDENGSDLDKKAAALALAEGKDGIKKNTEVMSTALALFANDWDKYEKILKSSDDDAISMKPEEFQTAHLAGVQALLARDGVKTSFNPTNKAELDSTVSKIARRKALVDKKVADAEKAGASREELETVRKDAKKKFGLTDEREAIYKANDKILIDFGKQIKKTGGDIDTLFTYERGKDFKNMDSDEVKESYKRHRFTMKDLSQQSALLQNKHFQAYATSDKGLTTSEINELAKMVAQNNKNDDVKVEVEKIKRAVEDRERKRAGGGSTSTP